MNLVLAWPGCTWREVAPAAARLGPVRIAGRAPARVTEGYTVAPDVGWDAIPSARHLLLPGGNLDTVWDDPALLAALRDFQGPIGAICNGALLLARAGRLVGRRCTHTAHTPYAERPTWAELLDHAEPALVGSTWVDADVVVDAAPTLIVTAKPWAAERFAEVFAGRVGATASPGTDPTDTWERWVFDLESIPGVVTTDAHIRAHVAHLRTLEETGALVLAGPFPEERRGRVVVRARDRDEAEAWMNSDPFVTQGVRTARLSRWMVSCAANRHLGRAD